MSKVTFVVTTEQRRQALVRALDHAGFQDFAVVTPAMHLLSARTVDICLVGQDVQLFRDVDGQGSLESLLRKRQSTHLNARLERV